MGIPITGKREAMVTKLKQKGFTEKTQENEVGVELKGKYLGSKVWLRIYNSNKSKTILLIYSSQKDNLRTCTINIKSTAKSLMLFMVNLPKY